MIRSAETYQEHGFETVWASFSDVIGKLLGPDVLSERLLHDGRPVVAARSGLQVCAALDAMGVVVPWREYMEAYTKEAKDDNTHYGMASDRQVGVSLIRGRLRLTSWKCVAQPEGESGFQSSVVARDVKSEFMSCVKWDQVIDALNGGHLPAVGVVAAIVDTFGPAGVVQLIESFSSPGVLCLALAQVTKGETPSDLVGGSLFWAKRAVDFGLPPGHVPELFRIGLTVDTVDRRPVEKLRAHLQELTHKVQSTLLDWDTRLHREWLDACAVAAQKDALGLALAEMRVGGPGWYTCWLRFSMALASAEASTENRQAQSSLEALRILTEVEDPFLGEPRACDLLPIHGLIFETFRRAFHLLDAHSWEEGVEILNQVSNSMLITLRGALGGPIPRDRFLSLVIETVSPACFETARELVEEEIKSGGADRYYSDLATYRLLAARLALNVDNESAAFAYWTDACQLLVAYSFRKDATIYELLNPIPTLATIDNSQSRVAVSQVQPLCQRITRHTDGKGTRHVKSYWWELLAVVDPFALSRFVLPGLLGSCNDPNWLLHSARAELFYKWNQRADPIVANALRLTMEEPLDESDIVAFSSLAKACDGTGLDAPSRLLTALLARFDERSFDFSSNDGKEHLERDSNLADALNCISTGAVLPRVALLPPTQIGGDDRAIPRNADVTEQDPKFFPPGSIGVAQAIRTWERRGFKICIQIGLLNGTLISWVIASLNSWQMDKNKTQRHS